MFFFLLGVLLSVLIYIFLIKPCNYWKLIGIKHAPCWPGVGSMGKVLFKKEAFMDVSFNLYNKHVDERYVGYMQFMQQCLLLRDLELIKQITVKDFNHFTDHAIFGQGTDADPMLSKSLVSLTGEKWKNMRATLSPAFTSSKMRNMYLLIEECVSSFVDNLEGEMELEMRDTFSKVACNVIATTAFGIKIDCRKEPDDEFLKMGQLLADFNLWQTLKLIVAQTSPKLAEFFQIEVFPPSATTFFRAIIKDNIKKRQDNEIVRPDLIHLLLEARKGKLKFEDDDKTEGVHFDSTTQHVELTDEHIMAQAMLFFLAGFDTITTTASFMAHELAVNVDVQKKLQDEIDGVRSKFGKNVPYEALLSMKYLDQVVSETLRLWPAAFETDRLCTKDYVIQSKNPGEKPFLVEKGVDVVIPVMGIHRDARYYPEPNRFDPERFSDDNKAKIVPGTFLPFGWGPRNCIGSRFAVLEIKTIFYHLLSKFELVPVARTETPIRISKAHFNLQPESGFWLGFKPRKLD
ncbi:cytochrome P450 9e2-like isoform X1 [Zophobas morio]|uniref:cytochrome P450 9e2-like isoform X1 n=2 Tax=Zophobas morio TaxID=2755281 RepID=UPI0030828BB9